MGAIYSKAMLSGSTDGKGVLVVATATPGTTIHTGPSTTNIIDEVWLYISNSDSSSHLVTIQWGGTTSPNDYIVTTVAAYAGMAIVVPGLVIQGNATPLVVRAFADTASKVSIMGYVNRITQ